MGMQGMGYYYPFHWFGMIIWFILLVLIIAGIILIIRSFMGSTKTGDQKRAIDILKERYAKGEISKDEYLDKKKDITGD